MSDVVSNFEMVDKPKNLQFLPFMLKLSRHFKSDDLEQFKFVLKETIPAGKMENLSTLLEVFSELQQRNIIGPCNLNPLRKLLENIERPHLISMVDEFDDSSSTFPLKEKYQNYLEMDGYQLSIKGGRHFETSEGEFVELQSGSNYALTITNKNNHRCICKIKIDGYDMYPSGLKLNSGQTYTLERPDRENQKYKLFEVADAPEGSGINKWRRNDNGVVKVVFTPEKADMKISCVVIGETTRVLTFTCSSQMTDSEFHEMVYEAFDASNVIVNLNNCKPLGKRDVELTKYGIQDGYQVKVNLGGGRGGGSLKSLPSIKNITASKKDAKWRAGATTLQGESQQKFVSANGFPVDPMLAVSLHLRLVTRDGEICLPSNGNCTPLARATLIPPPVPT